MPVGFRAYIGRLVVNFQVRIYFRVLPAGVNPSRPDWPVIRSDSVTLHGQCLPANSEAKYIPELTSEDTMTKFAMTR